MSATLTADVLEDQIAVSLARVLAAGQRHGYLIFEYIRC